MEKAGKIHVFNGGLKMTLVEKYRPSKWEEVVGNEEIIKVLKRLIKNDSLQHMIFYGPPGCGKTTMAYILASEYHGKKISLKTNEREYEELNASDARGIDIVRDHVKRFANTPSLMSGKKRILFLDEADKLTPDAQGALRAIMEKAQDNCVMILSMNHLRKITETALLSRCMCFRFNPQPASKLAEYLGRVATQEGIIIEGDILQDIVNHPEYQGDFRRVLNDTLQKLVGLNRKITKNDLPWIYRDSYKSLIDNMKTNNKYNSLFWDYYRKNSVNLEVFVRELFNSIENKSFELCKVFAEAEMNLKLGGDEICQLGYLLTAIQSGI